MHVEAVTACSGTLIGVLTAALVFTGSPPAYADGIAVRPNETGRGDSVSVSGSGCHGGVHAPDTAVTVTSPGLRTEQGSVVQGRFDVPTSVRTWGRGGRFVVTGTCRPSGIILTGTFDVDRARFFRRTVIDDNGFDNGFDRFDEPDRFPRTGGGGMANVADAHHSPIGGVAGMAGLVLLAGAVAIGGVTAVRSRARARGRG